MPLATAPIRNKAGQTKMAKTKKTGSSPPGPQNFLPKNEMKRPYTRLCSIAQTGMPAAETPVNMNSAFCVLVSRSLTVSTVRTTPNKPNTIARAANTRKGSPMARPMANAKARMAKLMTRTSRTTFLTRGSMFFKGSCPNN